MSETQAASSSHSFELDQEMFETYNQMRLGQKDYYELLTLPKDRKGEARLALYGGEDAGLHAEHHEESQLSDRISFMKGWKDSLLESEIDVDVKQLYRWRINEDIANMYMVQASQRGDMRNFARWNTFIYGPPNVETYGAAVDWIVSDAKDIATTSPDGRVELAAREVIDALPSIAGDKMLLTPDDTTFTAVRNDHFQEDGFFDRVLADVEKPQGDRVTRETGEPILAHILKHNLGDTYELGRAVGSAWSVSHQQSLLKQPDSYSMPWERFIGLPVGHEAATHIGERINAQMGQLGLMMWGLDRYEQGAEGRALIREQVPYETFAEFAAQPRWRFILERKIAISYGIGLGEDKPHGSAEVYELIRKIEYMYQLANSPTGEEGAIAKLAQTRSSDLALRVLKGTDGAGGAYRKDEVYLDGNVRAWQAAKERGAYAVTEGDKGKYDIANSRHVDYLQRLSVLSSEHKA
ncbi:hypothetical protein I8H83_02730 [Candidatus Saccharibacteria bacterium]|nr:hypothetical protein [Candidatus Saccharibacteria bacterium]